MSTTISLSANTLFHFTDSADNLISIVTNGFKPKFCLEQFGSRQIMFSSKDLELAEKKIKVDLEEAIPMTCFCDLPVSHISSHLEFYGSYGIGLTKNWGVKNGLTPLAYVHQNSTQIKHINRLAKKIWENANQKSDNNQNQKSLLISTVELAGFFKPYEGKMWRNGRYVDKRFYDEREWRYVPGILTDSQLDSEENKYMDYRLDKEEYLNSIKLAKANRGIENDHGLEFEAADVKYIIIKDDSEVDAMMEAIDSVEAFSKKEKRRMYSKILTSSQINEDF